MEIDDAWDDEEDTAQFAQTRSSEDEVKAKAHEAAKLRFERLMCGEESTPIERLRLFCSLAINGQGWLDVEPFFDALAAPLPAAPCSKCADYSAESETFKTQWAISCAERDALQAKVAEIEESARKSALNVGNWHRQFMKAMETVAEQYTLIEQCEQALKNENALQRGYQYRGGVPIRSIAAEALAAIASHKKGGLE